MAAASRVSAVVVSATTSGSVHIGPEMSMRARARRNGVVPWAFDQLRQAAFELLPLVNRRNRAFDPLAPRLARRAKERRSSRNPAKRRSVNLQWFGPDRTSRHPEVRHVARLGQPVAPDRKHVAAASVVDSLVRARGGGLRGKSDRVSLCLADASSRKLASRNVCAAAAQRLGR